MNEIATASINNLRISEADFVPSSEQSITVSLSQLRQIITDAVQDALQPLQDEVAQLQAIVASQGEKIASLETLQESEVSRLCVDIATDRRRLAALEKVEPQPLQKDRGDILRALIAANGGKMLAKDARQKMHLSKNRFSELLARMDDYIEKRPYHLDRTQNIIILR